MQADRLLGPEVSDVDGLVEERIGTMSVFNGPAPVIHELDRARDHLLVTSGDLPSEFLHDLQP